MSHRQDAQRLVSKPLLKRRSESLHAYVFGMMRLVACFCVQVDAGCQLELSQNAEGITHISPGLLAGGLNAGDSQRPTVIIGMWHLVSAAAGQLPTA